tara:strand:+ start:113597 stop:113839 length:243 start_codon:yes stop_codon:yes gene_type:complete
MLKLSGLLVYILVQRLFTFFDEWFFYCVLAGLFFAGYYLDPKFFIVFSIVGVYGGLCILNSYKRLWKLEAKMLEEDNSAP